MGEKLEVGATQEICTPVDTNDVVTVEGVTGTYADTTDNELENEPYP